MTLGQAMKKAIDYFEKKAKKRGAEIRNVYAQEASIGASGVSAIFKIEYAINGDYSESDKHPYIVRVKKKDGIVTVDEPVWYREED